VKNAGTTIGNFYNYFPNKEDLFEELVKQDYDMFTGMIHDHGGIEKPNYLWDVPDIGIWRKNLTEFAENLIPSLSDGFVLLMKCSGGTKFENTRDEFITISKEHFLEHTRKTELGNIYEEIAEIIAEQLLNAIVMILKKYKDSNMRKKLITEYIL
jgi:AcrR family transcriptional regulator